MNRDGKWITLHYWREGIFSVKMLTSPASLLESRARVVEKRGGRGVGVLAEREGVFFFPPTSFVKSTLHCFRLLLLEIRLADAYCCIIGPVCSWFCPCLPKKVVVLRRQILGIVHFLLTFWLICPQAQSVSLKSFSQMDGHNVQLEISLHLQ